MSSLSLLLPSKLDPLYKQLDVYSLTARVFCPFDFVLEFPLCSQILAVTLVFTMLSLLTELIAKITK